MTEKNLAPEQNSLSDEVVSENLTAYLRAVGSPDIRTVPQYDRRIMADIPLSLYLGPLNFEPDSKTDRDRLVSYFETHDWLPKQLQEANIAAIKGVDETLRRAQHSSSGKPEEAQANTYGSVKRYYQDGLHDVRTLNLVLTHRRGRSMEPNVESLRVSRPVLYEMADMFLAREFLDETKWPNTNWNQYLDRQRYWRGFMLFAAEYASDEVLAEAFNHFYEKAQNRRKFWSEEYREMDRKIGHLVTEKPKLSEEPSQTAVETGQEEAEEAEEATDFEALIPEGAQADLERAIKQYADKSAQIDRYVNDQGMPKSLAEERVLGGRALRYRGQVTGVDKEEPKISASPKTPRKPRTRQGLHGHGLMNADEPPPGIPDARRDRTG